MRFVKIRWALIGLLAVLIAGCGGGGGSDAGNLVLPGTGAGGTGGSGSTPVVTVQLAVKLLDANGAATTAIVAGQPVRAQAILTKNGVAVSNEIVQFAVDTADLVKIDPVSGSQLSDAAGLTAVTVSSLGAGAGAGRITASAKVGEIVATGAANFFASGSVGSQPATLTLGPVTVGSASVSAYGTTSIEVSVLQNGQAYTSPVTVNFTSSCAAGKSTITPSAITQPSGKAVATFVDNGCAQTADSTVTITASIGTDTKSTSMTVKAPTAGSLRFLSVVPSDKSITLRGQGGNGRQENATITFKLVDVAGNGVGDADVCFDVTTYAGGLNLDGFTLGKPPTVQGSDLLCGTDLLSIIRYKKRTNADGTVSVQINSGVVPTPVRVRARALYPASAIVPLETFSDTLSISTGLPLQRSFSLSVDQANIDGGNFDGQIAKLTVRLADQFSNPVPDGTVVNFIASGAAVCTADNGSCKTVNGVCGCDLVSQARRPADNRVVVTAYAVGLEDYDDSNGDNQYNKGESFFDLADVYVDANKDGLANSLTINGDTDILVPYQFGSTFAPEGDKVRGTAHIRASTVIYLSQASSIGDPTAVLPTAQLTQQLNLLVDSAGSSAKFLRLDPTCPQGSPLPQATLSMVLEDGIGNPMAAATSLAVVDSSDNVSPLGFRPSSVLAIGARPPSPYVDLPNLRKPIPWSLAGAEGTVVTPHSVSVRGVQDKCSGGGSFALEVGSPRGGKATARVLYDGEPRKAERFSFGVRYVTNKLDLQLTAPTSIGGAAIISKADYVGRADVVRYSIDWGDDKPDKPVIVANLPISGNDARHQYGSPNNYSVTLSLQRVVRLNREVSAIDSLTVVTVDPAIFAGIAKGGSFKVDWGDGSVATEGTQPSVPTPLTHVYKVPDHYTIRISFDETVVSTINTLTVPAP